MTTEDLRKAASEIPGLDISDDTFSRTLKTNDWRNHVPETIERRWKNLSERDRLLVALVAEKGANAENWD